MRLASRFSKVGMWLGGAYAVVAFVCMTFALWPGVDVKGRFVVLQLPIALQGGLLQELGLAPYLEKLGWLEAYVLLALPTIALLYFIGRFFDKRR